MTNRILKIILVSILGCGVLYFCKSYKTSDFEVGDIQLSQTKIDIKSLQTSFETPVWSVKSESPMTCFSITFKNEGERSFKETPGILDVIVTTLLEGAGDYDGIALKKLLTDNSINIIISPTSDDIQINVACLSKYFDLAIDILCNVLSKAHLKQENIEIAKQGCLVSIKQSMFRPYYLAFEKLSQLMYPEGHPYRLSFKDVLEKIPTYTREDCVKCYSSLFSSKDAEISIVSNLDEDIIKTGFNKIYKSIETKTNDFKEVTEQKTELNESGKWAHVELDNPQSSVLFAFPGVKKTSNKKFALRAATEIFGKPKTVTSRLTNTVRENGLVYRIKTIFESDEDMQVFVLGDCDTRPENVKKVVPRIKEVVKKFYKDGMTQEELTRFKHNKFAENILTTSESILEFVKVTRCDGASVENINSHLDNYYNLTLEEVNAVVRDVYNPAKLIFVDCGKSLKNKEERK